MIFSILSESEPGAMRMRGGGGGEARLRVSASVDVLFVRFFIVITSVFSFDDCNS